MTRTRPVENGEFRLDPVRWPGGRSRAGVARLAVTATLLLAAAGVLYTGSDGAPCAPGASVRTADGTSPPHSGPAATGPSAADPALADRTSAGPAPADPALADPAPDGPGTEIARRPRLAMPAGAVGVVVSLAEPAALGVLRAGDRVDLLASGGTDPSVLATGALVLTTPDRELTGDGLYLALRPEQARAVSRQPDGARFTVLVRS